LLLAKLLTRLLLPPPPPPPPCHRSESSRSPSPASRSPTGRLHDQQPEAASVNALPQRPTAPTPSALFSTSLKLHEPQLERADSGALFGRSGARLEPATASPGASAGILLGSGPQQREQHFLPASMYRSAEEGNVLQPEDSYQPLSGSAYAAEAAAHQAEAEPAEEQEAAREREQAGQEEHPSLVQQLAAGQQLLSMLRESQEILADMQRKVGGWGPAARSPRQQLAAGSCTCLQPYACALLST
jgi:hypothetical protein